jgi:hypothetical protein
MADSWIVIVSVALLLVSVTLLGALVIMRHKMHGGAATPPRPRIVPDTALRNYRQVQAQATQVSAPADGLGARLQEVEQQLRLLAERQDQLDLRQPADHAYRLAIKLAQKGVPIDDLVATCGINRGEAELIAMLHRYRKASGA